VGILDVLALKSAFLDLIDKLDQRLAAKFPSHTITHEMGIFGRKRPE
jgi:hypothetical protein